MDRQGTSSVRIGMVQPLTDLEDRKKNVENGVRYIEQAAALGADIVCLPETYPGPWTPPIDYDPLPSLRRAAEESGVYVIAGLIEAVPDQETSYYNTFVLVDSEGGLAGRYRRTTPPGPWIYEGGSFWDFDWQETDELPVFDTPWAKIGIGMCSEVYFPEVSRILALQGAEIVFLPAGIPKPDLWHTWRTLIFARAIENLCITATCQNVFESSDLGNLGLTMVCSPEEVLLESIREGVFVVECDLERVRSLREQEDSLDVVERRRCKPGIFKYWYRPELHGERLAEVGRRMDRKKGTSYSNEEGA